MPKSPIIIEEKNMVRTAIHPGEHLAEELRELGISAAELSRQIEVPVNRVSSIINGQRGITADTALRLGHWFGTSAEFWLNLQKLYELRLAQRESGERVEKLPRLAGRKRKFERMPPSPEPMMPRPVRADILGSSDSGGRTGQA
jgi:antitoxin HigA-1